MLMWAQPPRLSGGAKLRNALQYAVTLFRDLSVASACRLFHRHGFCQVPGLIHIASAANRNVIRQKLHRYNL